MMKAPPIVKVVPDVLVPSRKLLPTSQWRFGVGEEIYLAYLYDAKMRGLLAAKVDKPRWFIAQGGGTITQGTFPGEAKYTAPDVSLGSTSTTIKLHYKVRADGSPIAEVSFDVIAPTACSMEHVRDIHYSDGGSSSRWNNDPNGGFIGKHLIGPKDVSFARVQLRECGGQNRWTYTTTSSHNLFSQADRTGVTLVGRRHDEAHLADARQASMEPWFDCGFNGHARSGFYDQFTPTAVSAVTANGTNVGVDQVYNLYLLTSGQTGILTANQSTDTAVLEGAELVIPLHYRVRGGTDGVGRKIGENTHSFSICRNGTVIVSKGGVSATIRRDAANSPP